MSNIANQAPQQEKSVGFYALLVAFGTLTSRVLGLVRESLFAAFFPRTITDAWYVAFRLPNIFRRLFGEGSLSVAFIPVFIESRMGPDGAVYSKRFVNSFYTLFFLFLAVLTALGILFPEQILNFLLDENFKSIPGKFELTVTMSRIMFGYIFLVCTYAYFMAILNALGKFGLAAMAPTFFNIAIVISTLIPKSWLAWDAQALTWGVIIGGIVQAGVLAPTLRKSGYWPKFSFDFSQPEIWKVMRAMGPGILGLGLLQLTTLVNMRFASSFGEGPISYINFADRLLELPLSLVSVSIGSALLPTLSSLYSSNQIEKKKKTAQYYLKLNLFICLPAAVGLYVLAQPIIELLFQRGHFTPEDTLATSGVVKVYAGLIISTSLVRVFVPNFYAIQNTKIPALISAFCFLIHLGIAPLLMKLYGFYGLNLSSVITTSINFVFLVGVYRKLMGAFGWISVIYKSSQFLMMSIVMGAFLCSYFPVRSFVESNLGHSFIFWQKLMMLFLFILAGVMIYFIQSYLMKISEFKDISAGLLRRLRR